MDLNTEDMSKTIFMTVIALAIILSLSVFANAFAASDDNNNNKPSADQGARDAINNAPNSNEGLKKITKCFGPCENGGRGAGDNSGGGNGGSSSSHHRSHHKGHSSSSDNGIITSPTVLGDNSAATAIPTTE
ncbi:MAG: hypothetical protein ACJ71A_01185 [Nitrososphaeraceae archaeon]